MNFIAIIVLIFSFLGAIDWILGNKFGLGKEFEKGFSLFGTMTLSMMGIIVVAPAIGEILMPLFERFYNLSGIDPSVIPASVFANDMGGMQLARVVCKNESIGNFNAFITSSMMGCVISFTIPLSLSMVKKHQHKDMLFGLLCGIATIPIGDFAAGLLCGINPFSLIMNLLPLIIIAVIVGLGLVFLPKVCIKCFEVFGFFMKLLATVGLVCAIFTFLTKVTINQHFDTLENASFICVNACVTLSGTLPFMFVISKLLKKPFKRFGSLLGINNVSATAFLNTLVTNVSTFSVMEKMDRKGVVLNSAFAVSAAFAFGGHLALTLAYDGRYVAPMIVGKIISGICAVILAFLLYKEDNNLSENHVA